MERNQIHLNLKRNNHIDKLMCLLANTLALSLLVTKKELSDYFPTNNVRVGVSSSADYWAVGPSANYMMSTKCIVNRTCPWDNASYARKRIRMRVRNTYESPWKVASTRFPGPLPVCELCIGSMKLLVLVGLVGTSSAFLFGGGGCGGGGWWAR